MLGKVIKNEFKATWKLFSMMYVALIALTIITRLSLEVPYENKIFKVLQVLLTIVYVVLAFGISAITGVIAMARYYNNMHKDQGYLTHTLPVKEWKHIFSKTLVFTVWTVVSFIVSVISVSIFLIGVPGYGKIREGIADFLSNLFDYPKLVTLAVLFIILMIVQVVVNLLAFYSAISVGQSFKKHKIFGAILAYFAMNYAMSMLMNVMMLAADKVIRGMEEIEIEISDNSMSKMVFDAMNTCANQVFVIMGIVLVYEIIAVVVYYLVTNYMLNKKLNLE